MLLLCVALGTGCGDAGPPRAAPFPDDVLDADVGMDGGVEVADADLADAYVPQDGDIVSECNGDALSFPGVLSPTQPFSADIQGNQVHLAILASACGVSTSTGPRAGRYISFRTSGKASEPLEVANAAPACLVTRDLAMLSGPNGAASLFYGSNDGAGYEIHQADVVSHEPSSTLTHGPAIELFTAAAYLTEAVQPTLVYSQSSDVVGLSAASAIAAISPGLAPVEVLPAKAGHAAQGLVIGPLPGATGEARGVVAWLNRRDPSPGIYFQPIAATGAVGGELTVLSDGAGIHSDVALAAGTSGGAVAYTVSHGTEAHTIRFRKFDAAGQLDVEVQVTSSDQNVGELAMAYYARGYVVAFRRLSDPASGAPNSLRLLFLDESGHLRGERMLQTVSNSAGDGLSLLAASDGRLVAVWSDADDDADGGPPQPTVRVARVVCY